MTIDYWVGVIVFARWHLCCFTIVIMGTKVLRDLSSIILKRHSHFCVFHFMVTSHKCDRCTLISADQSQRVSQPVSQTTLSQYRFAFRRLPVSVCRSIGPQIRPTHGH